MVIDMRYTAFLVAGSPYTRDRPSTLAILLGYCNRAEVWKNSGESAVAIWCRIARIQYTHTEACGHSILSSQALVGHTLRYA